MNDNFCAKNMYKVAQKATVNLKEKEFQNATDRIINAAERGLTKTKITIVYPDNVTALKNLGFQFHLIDTITTYNTDNLGYPFYEVSWDGE